MAQPSHHVNSHRQECWEKLVTLAADCFPLLRFSPDTRTLSQSTFVFWINLWAGIRLHADRHLSLAFPFFIQRGFPILQHRVGWTSTSLEGSMLSVVTTLWTSLFLSKVMTVLTSARGTGVSTSPLPAVSASSYLFLGCTRGQTSAAG